MDVSAGIQASLAGRYASALFDLASEAGTITAVESDLDTLAEALRESAELRGEVTAEVASAHALTDEQLSTLEQKLRAREGRTVKLKTTVEAGLLGGLVVTIGSQRIDSSIRSRLNSLAQAMKG